MKLRLQNLIWALNVYVKFCLNFIHSFLTWNEYLCVYCTFLQPPLSSANYLYDMDRITQEIVNVRIWNLILYFINCKKKISWLFLFQDVLSAKKLGIESDIKIPKYNLTINYFGSIPQLSKLRRQFINYSKMQQIETAQIASLFVQYLSKSSWKCEWIK